MVELLNKQDLLGALDEFKTPSPEVPVEQPPLVEQRVYDQPPAPTELQSRFMDVIRESQEEEDQSTAMAMEAARFQNPELYRKAQKYSGLDSDLPVGVVYRNIDQFDQRERLDAARNILKTNPPLAEWFQYADNSRTISVENLQQLDKLAWTMKAGSRALTQGDQQIDVADIRWKQMFGQASPEEIARADQMEAMFQDDFGGASWLGRGYTGALSQLPIMGTVIREAAESAVVGGAIGAGVGSVVPGVGSFAGMGAGATAGAGLGAFKRSMQINGGLAFSEYSKFRTNDGRLIDQETAAGAAIIAGGLSAGLDTASFGVLLKATGLGSLLTKYGVKTGVKEALKNKTFLEVARAVGKRFAGAIGAETVTESIQQGIQIAVGEVAKGMEAREGSTFKPTTFAEAIEQMAAAGRDAFLATAFLGIVPMGGKLALDMRSAKQQEEDAPKIKQLVELAKDDKLVKEDPAKAAEVVQATLQGSDKETVYIDTETVKSFMQDDESPEMAALSKLPGFQQKLTEAIQTGADVAIPTADFYAYVAPSEAAAGVVSKLKFSPDGMSQKEAEKFVKALEKIKDEKIPTTEPEGSVSQDIYKKTRAAGATPDQANQYAALYGAFFDSMASQTGRTAFDIYKAYNVEILNKSTENPSPSILDSFKQLDVEYGGPHEPRSATEVRVSHGTNAPDFKRFNPAIGEWKGVYFTDNPDMSSAFAFFDGEIDLDNIQAKEAPRNIPVFIETKNFKEIDVQGGQLNGVMYNPETGREEFGSHVIDREVEKAQAEGFAGLIVRNAIDSPAGGMFDPDANMAGNIYIAWGKGTVRSALSENELLQNKGNILRGNITFYPDRTTINLFKNANLSTLLHETGHLFLQVMSDLVQGKRAYGNQLFQNDEIGVGDSVLLYDGEGKLLFEKPVVINGVVRGKDGQLEFTVVGGKGVYRSVNAVLVSSAEGKRMSALNEASQDAMKLLEEEIRAMEKRKAENEGSDAPPLPMGESPADDPVALGAASSPGENLPDSISEEDASFFTARFELTYATNKPFRVFVADKPTETAIQKRDLLFDWFPKSKEAQAYRQSKAHTAQNADPVLKEALASAGVHKKADPLGIGTETDAVLNIDQSIQQVNNILDATAKLQTAISKRQADRALKALRISMKKIRETEGVPEETWTELEAELQKVQAEGKFPDDVRKVVSEYIRLYKKNAALQTTKQANKAKREGEQAAKQVEAVRAETVAAAIVELANVVDRVEKIEQQKEARQSLIDDMKVIQDWLGESGPLFSRDAHEKFAKGFEAYLFEGVAPNQGLRRAFDRFKTWLKLVYRSITNIGTRPTPEVRAVFDRMLTIDQTVATEVNAPTFQAAFSSAEEMGVTQAEFEAYRATVDSLASVGREAAEKVAMSEAGKLRRKAILEKKTELRKQFREDLMGQRVYRVIAYLQGKKMGDLQPVKLDRERVQAIVGRGKLATIPNGASMWTSKDKGGVEPNTVATMFGYSSGAEMLADIQSVEPLKVAVEARVTKAVQEMAAEELVTPPEVAEMTSAKLRSEVYQEFLRTEIRTFAKLMGLDFTDAHVAQFKRMADEIIDSKSVLTVLRRNFMREYYEADRKVGKLLEEAIRKKDYPAILDLRRKQYFNSFLIQKAYEAKSKTDTAVKYIKGFTKSKSGKIDQQYLSQIRNLAISLGFLKGQIDPTARPFSTFLDEELDAGNPIVVDPRVKKQQNKPYMRLTHGELMAVNDAIKNLDFVGRNVRSIFKEGKVLDLNAAVAQIAAAMDRNLVPPKELPTLNRRGFAFVKYWVNGYFAAHTKIEQLCDWIDGRAPQGPAHRYIFQPMADAQAREVEMTRQYAQKVLDVISEKPSDYWSDEFLVPEIGKRVKRSEAMAVALNMGNESNLKKLKKGMGWTDQQLAAVTAHLDGKDWEIAQKIWDTIDGLWPHVLEVAARTGIPRPDKVEPVSFTNKYGTFRGGYYPVVYDPSKSADALARGLSTRAEQQFGFQPQSVFPAKSFANDRDNEYARPIFLDMTVLPQHIAKVVHYVTHAEAAYNVGKILAHKDFKDRLLSQFGEGMFNNMKGWMENITKGETDVAGLSGANKFMRAIRQNVSLAALGFRATTIIAQTGGVFAGAEMIGMSGVATGIKDMYGSASISEIQSNFEFIRSKSAEMRHRTQFLDRDLTSISEMFESPSMLRTVKDLALKPMMVADNLVASAVWMGAYRKQLARDIHDDATAVAYADKVVRLTQGAAGAKDLSTMQRGNEFFKLFSMFYTYFSAMQNRLMDIARTVRYRKADAPDIQSTDTPHEALRFLYLIVLPSVIFDFLMKGAMQGEFTDDDENTGTIGNALWKIASYSLAGFIGIRDFASLVSKQGWEWRYSSPPMLRNMEMIVERANRIIQGVTDENKDVKASDVLRTGIDAIGITTGAPIDAPTLILQNYLKAQEKGEEIGLADFIVRR